MNDAAIRSAPHAEVGKGTIEMRPSVELQSPPEERPEMPKTMLGRIWFLFRLTGEGFVADDAWSRGASIAYFTLFSVTPALLVVIAVAGLEFGRDAAEGAIVRQLSGLMGRETAQALETMIRSASDSMNGTLATIIGLITILIATTGVFGEVQSSLNAIWKATPRSSTVSRLVRARLLSLGLVVAFGFVLTVSLAVSAALAALSTFLHEVFPAMEGVLRIVNFLLSAVLISAMFASVYKILPDTPIAWRDVGVGALFATALFEGGKYLIALYIGHSNIASTFGAAGALIVLLLGSSIPPRFSCWEPSSPASGHKYGAAVRRGASVRQRKLIRQPPLRVLQIP
jgi:membrane protein